jgi:GNAT superfamily N-acetyltransferase
VNPLKIRKATLDDSAAIARLSGELGYPVQAHRMRERLERILERDTDIVFVAETNDVAGWIHAGERELLEIDKHCEILGLVVGSGQRGKGIGRRLIEAVEEWAPSRGVKQISVRSNVIRPESHPFYEQLGFERYKTQHAYRKRLTLPDS